MALTPVICTQCGAQIQVDGSKEAGICPNCGTAFITEKVINKFVTHNNFAGATFNVQGGPTIENLYILADRAYEEKKYDDADSYYRKILEQSANEWKAYYRHSIYDLNKEYEGKNLDDKKKEEIKNIKLKLANNAFQLMVKNDTSPTAEVFSSWFYEVAVTANVNAHDASTLMYKIFDYINNNYKENKKETIISVAEYFVDRWRYWHPFTDNLYKKLVELNSDGYLTDVTKRCLEKIYKETRDYTPPVTYKAYNPKNKGYDEWEKAYLEYFPERKDEVEKNFNDRCTKWQKHRASEVSEKRKRIFWASVAIFVFIICFVAYILD